MRRAKGKNTYNNIDDIDVPEMVHTNYERQRRAGTKPVSKKTVTKKPVKRAVAKKKKRRNIFPGVLLFALLALIVAFLVMMGTGWNDDGPTGALIPVDMEEGKLNVLLLGVDKEGMRTDAMMLVSYNMNEKKAELLSIPRDTQVKVTDRRLTRKINEIHAMHDSDNKLLGPMGSIAAVTALTSVPIHYYVEFSFDAIDELADAIGPVEFDVPDIEGNGKGMNYDDPYQDLHIHLKPGLQKLSGNQVQQFLRYRKSNDGSSDGSDLSRVNRQQEFLKAVVDQKVNIGLIAKVPSIFSKLKKNIKTNFSPSDAIKYAKYLNGFTSENLTTHNLPGESKNTRAGWYFICDLTATAQLIRDSFGYEAANITNSIAVNDISGTKNVLTSQKKPEKEPVEQSTPRPTQKVVEEIEPSEEPTQAPVVEETPTPTVEQTPEPTIESTPTPTPMPTPTPEVVTPEPTESTIPRPEVNEEAPITLD
ncbi:MAG: LCP family protein [Clostridia bacterium]|nr:LCP family protein [Clostridia bacterium]